MIQVKRVYEPVKKSDGQRFLVERLWPRGMKKEALHMKAWMKDAAPSTELRGWFHHDTAKWTEFQRRYRAELKKQPNAWRPLLEASTQGPVTLLFSSHDTEHNNAVALRDFLAEHAKASPGK